MSRSSRKLYCGDGCHLSRQLVLDRSDSPYGIEIRITKEAQVLSQVGGDLLSSGRLGGLYSEMLMQSQLMAFSLRADAVHQASTLRNFFVCIDQLSLNDPALIDELIQCGEALRQHGQTLVVVVNFVSAFEARFKMKKAIIQHIYHLKDHGIGVTLELHNSYQDFPETLTILDLFEFIKIPISILGFSLNPSPSQGFFNHFYDWMSMQKDRTTAAFIAEDVDSPSSNLFARALPFDYFQGNYCSPADKI